MKQDIILKNILLIALYFITGKAGFLLAFEPSSATILWPASGISVGFVYLFGYRLLPGVFLGAATLSFHLLFSADLTFSNNTSNLIYFSSLQAIWPCLQAGFCVFLANTFLGKKSNLEKVGHVLLFTGLTGILGCFISATGSTLTLIAFDVIPSFLFWDIATSWYLGDALGVMIFAPICIIILKKRHEITLSRKLTVIIPLTLLFSATVFGFNYIKHLDKINIEKEFEIDAMHFTKTANIKIDQYIENEIYALKSFIISQMQGSDYADTTLDTDVFSIFTKESFKHLDELESIFWAPHILDKDKKNFEQSMKVKYSPSFSVNNIADKNEKGHYFPIVFSDQRYSEPKVLGYDLASDAKIANTINKAIQTNRPMVQIAPELFSGKSAHSLMAIIPIIDLNNDVILGSVGLIFRLDKIISQTSTANNNDKISISMALSESEKNSILSYHEKKSLLTHTIKLHKNIDNIYIIFSQTPHVSWTLWLTLGVSIFIIYIVSCFLLIVTGNLSITTQIIEEQTQELRKSKDFLFQIMSHVPDLLFVKNSKSEVITANQAYLELWAPEQRSDVIGKTYLNPNSKAEQEAAIRNDQKSLKQGSYENFENITNYKGLTRRFFTKRRLFKDENDQDIIIGISRDMTDFLITQNKFLSFFDNSAEGIITFNKNGKIDAFNPASEEILGYKKSEIINKNMSMFEPEIKVENQTHNDFNINKYISDESQQTGQEIYIQNKNGRVFPVFMSCTQIQVSDQILYSVLIRDISLAKKMEEELIRSNRELESFAYIASHDLKAPLRHISMSAEHLRSTYKDQFKEKGLDFLNILVESSGRMTNMIDSLLDYARVGQEKQSFKDTSLNDIIDAVKTLLNRPISISEATIKITSDTTIHGNIDLLVKLFQNLVDNSIKYEKEKTKPEINISASTEGQYINIHYSDNGIGIPVKYEEQIFIIFKRLHAHEKYDGSGVGLAICKRIVEFHGGDIRLDTNKSDGCGFIIRLPIAKNNDA